MPSATLLVVDDPRHWRFPSEGVEIRSARDYLSTASSAQTAGARVFNLCDSYAYQSLGYYVSLLAEARGDRAIPSVATLRDFRSTAIARAFSAEIENTIRKSLKTETGNEFTLSIYFGQTLDKNHEKLGAQLYRLFPAPLMLAEFQRQKNWNLTSVLPLSANQIPESHVERVAEFGRLYFQGRHRVQRPKQRFLFDLAILVNPDEPCPPSNERALKNFEEAAREVGFWVERIVSADAARISEFDALFIRETTAVDHPTYQLSRLAHAEGLVVIDDPWSILRCANKIYLAESLAKAKLPAPHTEILTRADLEGNLHGDLSFPLVLKVPDAAFSLGVRKVDNEEQFHAELEGMLKESDLILAQEFAASDFDWRVGVLDQKALFVCKYYMAHGHWQIYNWKAEAPGRQTGKHETMHVEFAPEAVVDLALKATKLIGDGFYGVDIKQVGDRLMVIEVNDNPNVDAGVEDAALGQELYRRVARSLRRRIELARA
ncbi:MAG: glutathione synthase/RimK-type ligase-like ATP-grasp enzyme [Candidatus Binatia bacterium]|jgi:glutathione synthase/RimK-type ligase-like ATP-grasp enzyme